MSVRGTEGRILLLDDDRALREMAAGFLRNAGHHVDDVGTLEQALARLRSRPYEVVLSDLVLGEGSGLDLLKVARREEIPCEVIIMTGYGGVEAAVQAIQEGAYDFITKPLSMTRLELDVRKALEKRRLEEDLQRVSENNSGGFGELLGSSAAMQSVFGLLRRAAACESNVLLLGESGTGKEVAAREIHRQSARCKGPFIPVHCGALPPELLESELFGHRKGAFTGADRARNGLFAAAGGGTLFLDEIATAPARVQIGMLRALQERRVRPVGGDEDLDVDVRVIAATNADLEAEMEENHFRQDLYYRLATIVITLPPLRDHREDIGPLAGVFFERLARKTSRRVTLSPRAIQRLSAYDWPGNVRELEHMIERLSVVIEGSVVRARDLPLPPLDQGSERIRTLEEVERSHIELVLDRCSGNKLQAARLLGIPRATLYRKIQRFGLERRESPKLDAVPDATPGRLPGARGVPARDS